MSPGDLVNFQGRENGIVKSVTEHGIFVVYNCGGDWDSYRDYTAALTKREDLQEGWIGCSDSTCA